MESVGGRRPSAGSQLVGKASVPPARAVAGVPGPALKVAFGRVRIRRALDVPLPSALPRDGIENPNEQTEADCSEPR